MTPTPRWPRRRGSTRTARPRSSTHARRSTSRSRRRARSRWTADGSRTSSAATEVWKSTSRKRRGYAAIPTTRTRHSPRTSTNVKRMGRTPVRRRLQMTSGRAWTSRMTTRMTYSPRRKKPSGNERSANASDERDATRNARRRARSLNDGPAAGWTLASTAMTANRSCGRRRRQRRRPRRRRPRGGPR